LTFAFLLFKKFFLSISLAYSYRRSSVFGFAKFCPNLITFCPSSSQFCPKKFCWGICDCIPSLLRTGFTTGTEFSRNCSISYHVSMSLSG